MRIRGTKQELEEAGEDVDGMVETTAELRDLVKGLTGFDIMADQAGTQFKDIYDIVVGIDEEFKNLTDTEQAGLLEALAGKRQGNYLAAALNNIETIKAAYNTAEFESDGSAMRELENYQKGIEYSVEKFKATFQELSNTTISSDFVKGIVDSGTVALDVITNLIDKLGLFKTLIASIGGNWLTKNGLGKRDAALYKVKQNNRRFINVESSIA